MLSKTEGVNMREINQIDVLAKEHIVRASGLLTLLMPQTSGIGFAVKGRDGCYQLVNKAMETLLDRTAGQIMQLADHDIFPPAIAERLENADRLILDGASATRDELDFLIGGLPVACLCLKFPVFGTDGAVLSIGMMLLDTSRQEDVAHMRRSLERLQQTNQELQKALIELDSLASTDKLTGAWNRRRFEETVSGEMERLRRYGHPLSLLIIDIDFFKKINDQYGHVVGDQVLAQLSATVLATIRTTDSLTRWGGEEFIVLCPDTMLSTAAMLAERLREKIARTTFPVVGNITVSIGVAECLSGEVWESWFMRADAALYRAKACGRNQIQIAPDPSQREGEGEKVAANFVQLSWHAAYECGHPTIDDQHRALFQHANNLLTAILSACPVDEISMLIDMLIDAVVQHFKDEESIFTGVGFPGAADHAAIHRELVDHAVILVSRFHEGKLAIGELFQFLAHDVVAKHMLGADREFFSYLKNHY